MNSGKGNPGKTNGNGGWAALHQQEGKWRLLVARRRDRLEILESRTITQEEFASLPALFEQHAVTHVVRVAPGRETVARCVQVPTGDEAGLVAAVSLLAEAELPSSLPHYRRAAGLLPDADGGEMRTALLTGWMSSSAAPDEVSEVPEIWTTPAAALAMLRGDSGRTAIYTEPSEGLMCLLLPGPERTIARVLVEQPADDESWSQSLAAAVTEAAQMAGAAPSFAQGLNASRRTGPGKRVFLEAASLVALKARVSGLREDTGWLDDFGPALGALLAASSDQPSLRALATIHARVPEEERTIIETFTAWISRPQNAAAVLAAACVLTLLGPLGLAYGRSRVLEARAEKVKSLNVGAEGIEKRAAMYDQFTTSRWPMMKLLSDAAAATPENVVVNNIQITNGQGLVMQGTAEYAEDVNKLEANLNATKVFSNVSINRQDTKGAEDIEFDVSAKVIQPNTAVKNAEDFTVKTLAVRRYGEGASNTTAPSGAAHEERTERGNHHRDRGDKGDRTADNSNGGGGGSGGGGGEARRPASSTPSEVPPPLTDADIAKMDFSTAVKEWAARKTYPILHKDIPASAKQRLAEEVPKLEAQKDKMKGKADAPAAGAAAPPAGATTPPAAAPVPATPPANGGKQ